MVASSHLLCSLQLLLFSWVWKNSSRLTLWALCVSHSASQSALLYSNLHAFGPCHLPSSGSSGFQAHLGHSPCSDLAYAPLLGISPTTFSSPTLLHSGCSCSCSLHVSCMVPPQALCTCCSLWLRFTFCLQILDPLTQVTAQVSSLQKGLSWPLHMPLQH